MIQIIVYAVLRSEGQATCLTAWLRKHLDALKELKGSYEIIIPTVPLAAATLQGKQLIQIFHPFMLDRLLRELVSAIPKQLTADDHPSMDIGPWEPTIHMIQVTEAKA